VQRAKQAIVLDPPGLLVEVPTQRAIAIAAAPPLALEKALERRAQRAQLQPPHVRMLDARRTADRRERRPILGGQRRFSAECLKLRHARDADEDRIDRQRADRRVGRLLARRHLVERQELQDPLAGRGQPGGHRLDVTDVADTPTRRGGAREQRDEQARAALADRGAH